MLLIPLYLLWIVHNFFNYIDRMYSSLIFRSAFILPVVRKCFKRSWYHKVPRCQFLFLYPYLVYLPDQALSILRFQPWLYCAEMFHKYLISSGINLNYNIRFCFNNLSLFWYQIVKLLYVVTVSFSIGILHTSHTIIGYHQWVYLPECQCHYYFFLFYSDRHCQTLRIRIYYYKIPHVWQ